MTEIWYELYNSGNGEPICYLKDENYIKNLLTESTQLEKIDHKPAQLEFLVKKEGETIGSFKLETHAIRYNVERLNTKGDIEPNPQNPQLKMDL